MASRIITKKGSGAPLASDLVHGELAVDTVNKRLYTENAGGTVIEVGTSPSTIDINAGTIDGTVIGGTTAAAGTFTTFTSTGIDDNATSTAITIDSSNRVSIAKSSTISGAPLEVQANASGQATNIYGRSSDGQAYLGFFANGTNTEYARISSSNASDLKLRTGGSDRVVVSATGIDVTGTVTADGLTVDGTAIVSDSTVSVLRLLNTGTTGDGLIHFGDSDSNFSGVIQYNHDADYMALFTATQERMRIDSSGNLLVGKTATNSATAGAEVRATGALLSAVTSNFCGFFNRISTDGTIIEFAKNDAVVGSIGTRASLLKIGTGDVGLLFNSSSDAILPENIDGGVGRDAAIDLGVAGAKFKDLYLSGGVYLGGTGAANKLDDYEEGTWTPSVSAGSISGTSITYTGKYVKVGDMVTFTFDANSTSADIQVSSYVTFGGLPFTLSNDATSTVVTEDIDVFARQGFAQASGTVLSLSACGSSSGTSDLHVSITAKISA